MSYGAGKNAVESYTVAAAAELAQATPPFRIAQPDEVAELIVFLASHPARSINAQRIVMR